MARYFSCRMRNIRFCPVVCSVPGNRRPAAGPQHTVVLNGLCLPDSALTLVASLHHRYVVLFIAVVDTLNCEVYLPRRSSRYKSTSWGSPMGNLPSSYTLRLVLLGKSQLRAHLDSIQEQRLRVAHLGKCLLTSSINH